MSRNHFHIFRKRGYFFSYFTSMNRNMLPVEMPNCLVQRLFHDESSDFPSRFGSQILMKSTHKKSARFTTRLMFSVIRVVGCSTRFIHSMGYLPKCFARFFLEKNNMTTFPNGCLATVEIHQTFSIAMINFFTVIIGDVK